MTMNANLLVAHHSFSSVSEFDSCRRLYWARKVEGLKDPPTDKMSFGRDFGSAVLKQAGLKPEPGSPSDEDFGRGLAPEAEAAATFYLNEARGRGYDLTGAVAERPLRITVEMWEDLCKYYDVPSYLTRPIVAYPDLELMDRTLVELKTTDREGFQPSYTFQVLLYVMGLHALGKSVKKAEVHQLKHLTRSLGLKVYPIGFRFEWFKSTLQWYSHRIKELEEVLAADTSPCDLKESIGRWCNRCPLSLKCHTYQSTLIGGQ